MRPTAFGAGRAKLALGVGYAWGSKAIQQPIVLPSETPATHDASYSRWTISVGASFHGGR